MTTPIDDTDDDDGLSRRVFVHRLAFFGGGAVVLQSCKDEAPKPVAAPPPAAPKKAALTTSHKTFTNEEFATLSAAVERVLPKDEDVGAVEAGVPEYIDRILQTPQLAKMKGDFVPGLNALDRRCQRVHKVPFAQATAAQQDDIITVFKDSPEKSGEAKWYELLMVLSLEGFLGDPSYGGNKDEAGWKLMGFHLVGRNVGDPQPGYDGLKHLHDMKCGGGKGC